MDINIIFSSKEAFQAILKDLNENEVFILLKSLYFLIEKKDEDYVQKKKVVLSKEFLKTNLKYFVEKKSIIISYIKDNFLSGIKFENWIINKEQYFKELPKRELNKIIKKISFDSVAE